MDSLDNSFTYDDFLRVVLPLDLDVSRETFLKLKHYVALVCAGNEKFNLMGPREVEKIWCRHVLDSAQLLSFLRLNGSLVDLGAGAGFPGVVLAIMMKNIHVTLVEASKKKAQFLETVSRETNIPIKILNQRIENLPPIKFSYITARALAGLEKLLEYAFPLCSAESICIFNKGESYEAEIEMAKRRFDFDLQIFPSITNLHARILLIKKLSKKT